MGAKPDGGGDAGGAGGREAPLFACEGVGKSYGGEPVIAGVSLGLRRGGFISIVGPSGAGKTTLCNALAALDPPDSGRVFSRGRDISGERGHVAYMPQKDLLLGHLTTLDNVILPLLLRGEKKRAARARARPLFGLFGLSGGEDKYPAALSGGMRRRAALLRTCLWEKPVVLLDEPFAALDAISRLRARNWYEGVARELRLSTLCVTHDIEEAAQLSDEIYVLSGKPARLGAAFPVPAPRPRGAAFLLSPECARLKQSLLDALAEG